MASRRCLDSVPEFEGTAFGITLVLPWYCCLQYKTQLVEEVAAGWELLAEGSRLVDGPAQAAQDFVEDVCVQVYGCPAER